MFLRQQGLSLDYNLIEHSLFFKKDENEKGHGHRRIQTKGHPCQNSLPVDRVVHIGTWHHQFSSEASLEDQSILFWLLCGWQLSHISGTIIFISFNSSKIAGYSRGLEFPGVPNHFPTCLITYSTVNTHVHILLAQVQECWSCFFPHEIALKEPSMELFAHLESISISIASPFPSSPDSSPAMPPKHSRCTEWFKQAEEKAWMIN